MTDTPAVSRPTRADPPALPPVTPACRGLSHRYCNRPAGCLCHCHRGQGAVRQG